MKEQLIKAIKYPLSDRSQVSPASRLAGGLIEGTMLGVGAINIAEGNFIMGGAKIAAGVGIEVMRRLTDRDLKRKYKKPLIEIWEQLKNT